MKKIQRKILTAILTVSIFFSQTGIFAFANGNNDSSNIQKDEYVLENLATTQSTQTAELIETFSEQEEGSIGGETENITQSENESHTELESEIETETQTEDEKETETELENETESETETESEIETETETEIETEIVIETETGTEEDVQENLFSGLPEGMELSSEQIKEKNQLKSFQTEINEYVPNVDYEEGEILVEAESLELAKMYAQAYNGELVDYYEKRGISLIKLSPEATVADAVNASINASTRVNYTKGGENTEIVLPPAWPNYLSYTCSIGDLSGYTDTYLGNQWFHEYIGSEYAWVAGYTGKGIDVAIIDTGVYQAHEDLDVERGRVYVASEGYKGQLDTTDTKGHGTHVAGIVAADGNNGTGVSGIAPDANIYSYRVFGSKGTANRYDTVIAIDKAVEDGNEIINLSLGGPGYTDFYHEAIQDANKAGVAVFVAAGNEYCNSKNVYPANFKESITVAAINQTGGAVTFSNTGSHIDLAFPGYRIYSTVYSSGSASYTYKNGTSMACPAAAGTAAVILSANPKALQGKKGKAKVDALLSLMKSSAIKSSSSGMGSGTTYLPKAIGLSAAGGKPNKPTFSHTKGTYGRESIEVSISAEIGKTIYYSTDGKNPTYKNGVVENGIRYNGTPVTITGARNVTLKAIAVNYNGKSSSVASVKYTLNPIPDRINIYLKDGYTNTIPAGKSTMLEAVITPSYSYCKKVKWEVSPAGQGVTVSNGKVTAKSNATPDIYTITATCLDAAGNPIGLVKPATTSIMVTQKPSFAKVYFTQKTINAEMPTATYVDLGPYLVMENAAGEKYPDDIKTTCMVKSSNEKVAQPGDTESGQWIKLVGPGTAKITVIPVDGSGKKATITVKVTSKITGITIGGPNELAKGKNITLTSAFTPVNPSNKKLDWFISPEGNGVTVKNGKVTAGKNAVPGTYYITAKAKDGSEIVSNSYPVKVLDGAITKISFSEKEVTIFVKPGNYSAPTTYQLKPIIEGTGSYNKTLISYENSAPGIATVSQSGFVEANAAGKTTITVKALDGSKKSAKITVNVNIPMSKLKIAPKGGVPQNLDLWTNEFESYVAKGYSISLGAKYYDDFGTPTDKSVVWESLNESIATVDKYGKVKMNKDVATGATATIRVRSADGSNVWATFVVEAVEPATSFSFVKCYDSSKDVTYFKLITNSGTVVDEIPSFKVSISGGNNRCTVKEPKKNKIPFTISAGSRGTYTITVTLLDGSNKKAKIKLSTYEDETKYTKETY